MLLSHLFTAYLLHYLYIHFLCQNRAFQLCIIIIFRPWALWAYLQELRLQEESVARNPWICQWTFVSVLIMEWFGYKSLSALKWSNRPCDATKQYRSWFCPVFFSLNTRFFWTLSVLCWWPICHLADECTNTDHVKGRIQASTHTGGTRVQNMFKIFEKNPYLNTLYNPIDPLPLMSPPPKLPLFWRLPESLISFDHWAKIKILI